MYGFYVKQILICCIFLFDEIPWVNKRFYLPIYLSVIVFEGFKIGRLVLLLVLLIVSLLEKCLRN